MDTRRFDKNADQLVQIMAHISTIDKWGYQPAADLQHYYLAALEKCLELNDKLGKMAELGLI